MNTLLVKNRGKFFVGKISNFVRHKGWFFGHFMDQKLLKSSLIEVAWQDISGKRADSKDKHFHKKSVEINIVISGRVKLLINNKQFEVSQGEFYVIYPYTIVTDVEAGLNTKVLVIRAPSLVDDKFST